MGQGGAVRWTTRRPNAIGPLLAMALLAGSGAAPAAAEDLEWQNKAPGSAGFSVDLPGFVVFSKKNPDPDTYRKSWGYITFTPDEKAMIVVSANLYLDDVAAGLDLEDELNAAIARTVGHCAGTHETTPLAVDRGHAATLSGHCDDPEADYRTLLWITDAASYRLTVSGTKAAVTGTVADAVFSSFRLTD